SSSTAVGYAAVSGHLVRHGWVKRGDSVVGPAWGDAPTAGGAWLCAMHLPHWRAADGPCRWRQAPSDSAMGERAYAGVTLQASCALRILRHARHQRLRPAPVRACLLWLRRLHRSAVLRSVGYQGLPCFA